MAPSRAKIRAFSIGKRNILDSAAFNVVRMHVEPEHDERLRRWVTEHAQPLFGFLWAMTRNRPEAEDLLQDVFCRAWQARERYVDQGADRAYLLRIADRLLRDRHRQRTRRPVAEPSGLKMEEVADVRAWPQTALELTETQQQLTTAMQSLTEIQRRTLLLRYYGNLEFSQIATILRCPVSTALSHARRGLLALRAIVAEESL